MNLPLTSDLTPQSVHLLSSVNSLIEPHSTHGDLVMLIRYHLICQCFNHFENNDNHFLVYSYLNQRKMNLIIYNIEYKTF